MVIDYTCEDYESTVDRTDKYIIGDVIGYKEINNPNVVYGRIISIGESKSTSDMWVEVYKLHRPEKPRDVGRISHYYETNDIHLIPCSVIQHTPTIICHPIINEINTKVTAEYIRDELGYQKNKADDIVYIYTSGTYLGMEEKALKNGSSKTVEIILPTPQLDFILSYIHWNYELQDPFDKFSIILKMVLFDPFEVAFDMRISPGKSRKVNPSLWEKIIQGNLGAVTKRELEKISGGMEIIYLISDAFERIKSMGQETYAASEVAIELASVSDQIKDYQTKLSSRDVHDCDDDDDEDEEEEEELGHSESDSIGNFIVDDDFEEDDFTSIDFTNDDVIINPGVRIIKDTPVKNIKKTGETTNKEVLHDDYDDDNASTSTFSSILDEILIKKKKRRQSTASMFEEDE